MIWNFVFIILGWAIYRGAAQSSLEQKRPLVVLAIAALIALNFFVIAGRFALMEAEMPILPFSWVGEDGQTHTGGILGSAVIAVINVFAVLGRAGSALLFCAFGFLMLKKIYDGGWYRFGAHFRSVD